MILEGATTFKDLCTKCGACCRQLKSLDCGLPITESGKCGHLIESEFGSQCAIYESRPAICRFGFSYQNSVSIREQFSEAEHLSLAIDVCNFLQEREALPDRFRMRLRDG